MNQSLHLTPAPGLRLRDPATGFVLPEEGTSVPITEYWRRRIIDGDAVATDPQPEEA